MNRAGFANGSWGGSTQHAVTPERIEESKTRYGTIGGVTVKAVCGAWVVPTNFEYGDHYSFRCQNCERILAARARKTAAQ